MRIRSENFEDHEVITGLQRAAFMNHPQHPPGAEPVEDRIVTRLREAGELSVSLVAEEDGQIVGHVALSPASLDGLDAGWLLLGPIGVEPSRQRRGIGSALMGEVIRLARERGAAGIVLVGDPGFYGRFGFRVHVGLTYGDVPGEYVLALPLSDAAPTGEIGPRSAFDFSRPEG